MDNLEKKVIEKYGTGIIPAEDCNRILDEAARAGLIERKDIISMGATDTSRLLEHISTLRRQFLISGSFGVGEMGMDEAMYEGLSGSRDDRMNDYRNNNNNSSLGNSYENSIKENNRKENSKILDNVMKAFVEYEKIRTRPRRACNVFYSVFIVFIIAACAFLYTPAPY